MDKEVNTIVFFTKYTYAGASSRYRVYQYLESFKKSGFNILLHPFFTDGYLQKKYSKEPISIGFILKRYIKRISDVLRLNNKSLVYVEYELLPYFPAWLEKWLNWKRIKYVVDYDDAIFHNYDWKGNSITKFLLSNKIPAVIQRAAHVITGSEYLTQFALRHNANTTEIPTSIDYEKYFSNEARYKNDNEFIVGWIGTPSSSINVVNVWPAIKEFMQAYPAKLLLIGFDKSYTYLFEGMAVEIEDWNEGDEIKRMKSFDVGIMPLDDTPFNRGKCGFKLIQYMACGLPTIFSPLQANIKINKNKKNLAASSPAEWVKALEEIYKQRSFYKTAVGFENTLIAEKYYSTKANELTLINIFKELREK